MKDPKTQTAVSPKYQLCIFSDGRETRISFDQVLYLGTMLTFCALLRATTCSAMKECFIRRSTFHGSRAQYMHKHAGNPIHGPADSLALFH